MSNGPIQCRDQLVLDLQSLRVVFDLLVKRGYKVLGPTLRDGAIIYDELASLDDLPAGWTDVHDGGTYRLLRREDDAFFGYTNSPQSWKRFLHPPSLRLWHAQRVGATFHIKHETGEVPKLAFLGVRACELNAIVIQDNVFIAGKWADPAYRARREKTFIIAVNCGQAGGTCFCVSMGTGPKATSGFDLALTEVLEDGQHSFVVEVGTEAGAELMAEVPHDQASEGERVRADRIVQQTAEHMGRTLNRSGLKELLYRSYEHPRWEQVAARCLTCANCTMVCPTCFCTTVEDATDLKGEHAERWRRWDSCFTADFSYIHGGSIRATPRARYRQWMVHKLATWIDQFGTSGCVGCGRCITWCPVGIDITVEAQAIRGTPASTNKGAIINGDA